MTQCGENDNDVIIIIAYEIRNIHNDIMWLMKYDDILMKKPI